MANRRCFSNVVIDSDDFYDLSDGAKLLYFHLGLKTDDDGFLTGFKKILAQCGQTEKQLQELEQTGFIIRFDKCLVICHHRIHNTLRSDRYRPTVFCDDFERLTLVNNVYHLIRDEGNLNNSSEGKEGTLREERKETQVSKIRNADVSHSVNHTDTDGIPHGYQGVTDDYDSYDEMPFV